MAHIYARAILQQRSNSHPFEERYLEFSEPIKVGRAVARCKPLSDNAIFDCKVLSRNHALLSFENGKFLLRDTRSSNGTFVNNHRLSPANEDSAPEDLYSGDVVQFGVEVMESAKKMTHGCIVLTIKLYYPNGDEAIRPSNHISNHMMMPSNLLYEPSTFMQQHVGPLMPDQASMLTCMYRENPRETFANKSSCSNQISNGGSGTLTNNNASTAITATTNSKNYLPDNNNIASFKSARQNSPYAPPASKSPSSINNGKQTSTNTRIGIDGQATILKKPPDPSIKHKLLDIMSPDNYTNSNSFCVEGWSTQQGSNQQSPFCPPATSNSDQSNSNNGNSSINMMSVVSSYYCDTINFFNLLKEATQREQLLRQKLQQAEKVIEEAHSAADKGWRACIEEDLLLSKIETLQKKLEFLMRANKVAKLKGALNEAANVQDNQAGDVYGVSNHAGDTTKRNANNKEKEKELINDLEHQLQEKVLNYIDDKEKFELIAKDAMKKALQKEYLAFQQIHDLEALLKTSEDECKRLKSSNEKLEQLSTSRDVVHQKQSEEMTQERLTLLKDIDDLKLANSQLMKQYESAIHESERKVNELEHSLELASQQICDTQLKDKQLANLRYQLSVVNSLYQQADENNQYLKEEVDVKTIQLEQLMQRISVLTKDNASLTSELETHKSREMTLSNQEKDVNFFAIIPPIIILLTILIAYLIGTP